VRITFDRIGLGCGSCANKPGCCPKCERNQALTQLRDFHKKVEIPKPPFRTPKVGDDTRKVSEGTRAVLGEYGIHLPPPCDAPPPGEQEPKG